MNCFTMINQVVNKHSRFLLCAILLIGCSHSDSSHSWDGLRTDNNGIIVNENFGMPFIDSFYGLYEQVSVSTENEIDGHFIARIHDLLFIEGKGMYVADATNMRICSFDTEGHFRSCFGREGSGPGEFRNITNLVHDSERDQIGVFDSRLSRFSWFSLNDETHVHSLQIEGRIGSLLYDPNEGFIFSEYVFQIEDAFFVSITDSEGRVQKSVAPVSETTSMNVLSGNTPAIALSSEHLYVAYPNPYMIELFTRSEFDLSKRITLQKEGFDVAETHDGTEASGGLMLGKPMPSKINGVFLNGDDGGIVVESQIEPGYASLDYFDADGRYLYSVELPFEHRTVQITNGRIYTFIRGINEELAGVFVMEKRLR